MRVVLTELRVREIAYSGWDRDCCTTHEAAALAHKVMELEAENARLRQQRDAANAQLDWLIEQTGTKRIIRSNMDECE